MKKAIRNLLHRLKRFLGIISILAAVSLPIEATAQQPIPVKGNVQLSDSNGTPINVSVDGHLETEVHGPVSAFGEVMTAELTPLIQEHFVYGASTEAWSFFINGGASTSTSNNMLTVNGGAGTFSLATARTRQALTYRAGQGAMVRFTAKFSTGTIGASQFVGLGNSESALGFATDAATGLFGVFRSSGGLRDVNMLSIGTKSSNAQNATITLDGQAFTCPVTNGANAFVTANEIGNCDYTTLYPGWVTHVSSSTVYFIPTVPGPMTGTFSASFPTSGVGSFGEVEAGKNPYVETAPQSQWNVDKFDGTSSTSNPTGALLDPTKLSVYEIQYQYLGAGLIEFKVEEPNSGEITTVHRMKYAGREYTPSLSNPSLPFVYSIRNVGVAGNNSISGASVGAFIRGKLADLGQQRSYQVSKTGITTTLSPILTLQNSRLFGSRINQKELKPLSINISNTGGKPLEVQVFEQTVLGNDNYFAYVSTQTSTARVDFSATTSNNGIPRLSRSVSVGASVEIDLSKYGFSIEPGNQISILVKSNSTTTDAIVSIQWLAVQ